MRWGGIALRVAFVALAGATVVAGEAYAQRADDNAVRAAQDAFGVTVGNERIGVYYDRDVRGFSPVSAGNVRLEGLYFDMRGNIPTRLLAGTQIKVGLTAQGYPFPAPTGIVDYQLKQVGSKPVYTALAQLGPNEGYSYELEAYRPMFNNKLGMFAGAVVRREEPTPAQTVQPISVGTLVRWRPVPGLNAMAFYGHFDRYGSKATANVFTAGAFLPPDVKAQRFSQDWTGSDLSGDSYGATLNAKVNENWKFDGGVFRYFQLLSGSTTETYLNTGQDGLAASRRFRRDPENKMDSYSGEARVTGVFTGESVRQTVNFSFRARDAMRTLGGSSQVTMGPAQIGIGPSVAEPVFTFGPQTRDEVTQVNVGGAYHVAWRGVGEASVGVQKVDYQKIVFPPGAAPIITQDSPILHNFTLAATPTDKLVIYASYTRGLEDANNAPDIAVNAAEAPPAIRTEQRDIGIRYVMSPRLKLVAGYFEIEKPYFNLDPGNLYRQLGTERHSGVELSLSGQIGERLNVVAGAVLMKPEVVGEAVASGQIGERPVGQPQAVVRLNLDYRVAAVPGLSLDAALNYTGERAATSKEWAELGGEQLMTEDFATLDLGARYRFKAFGGKSATLRLLATNVTDEFAWQVQTSGALNVSSPRAFQASFAVDF